MEFSIATMTLVRSAEEGALLRESLEILSTYNIPVHITDGGSPPDFLDFLKQFSHFTVSPAPASGLFAQVTNSLAMATQAGNDYVLYTEPDKKFFFRAMNAFLTAADNSGKPGIFLASRSEPGFQSYPAFQHMTETCINNCSSEATGYELDYTYGPFLLHRKLVSCLDFVKEDIGWGWRLFMFGMAKRLGLKLDQYRGEYYCPPDQQSDSPDERIYRMRQLEQSIRGIVLSKTVGLELTGSTL